MSIRKFWPDDRLKRFDALKAEAQKHGLVLTARNAGVRHVPLYQMTFSKAGAPAASFFDIGEAEQWFARAGINTSTKGQS